MYAAICTGLVLILLLAGCGGDPPEPELGDARSSPATTLVAALGDHPSVDGYRRLAADVRLPRR